MCKVPHAFQACVSKAGNRQCDSVFMVTHYNLNQSFHFITLYNRSASENNTVLEFQQLIKTSNQAIKLGYQIQDITFEIVYK